MPKTLTIQQDLFNKAKRIPASPQFCGWGSEVRPSNPQLWESADHDSTQNFEPLHIWFGYDIFLRLKQWTECACKYLMRMVQWLCEGVQVCGGVIAVIVAASKPPWSSPSYLAAPDWHLIVDPHTFCHTSTTSGNTLFLWKGGALVIIFAENFCWSAQKKLLIKNRASQ